MSPSTASGSVRKADASPRLRVSVVATESGPGSGFRFAAQVTLPPVPPRQAVAYCAEDPTAHAPKLVQNDDQRQLRPRVHPIGPLGEGASTLDQRRPRPFRHVSLHLQALRPCAAMRPLPLGAVRSGPEFPSADAQARATLRPTPDRFES